MANALTGTTYPFDPTGKLASNKITGEQHVITAVDWRDYHYIVPKKGPFFRDRLVISYKNTSNVVRPLVEGQDYLLSHRFMDASLACASDIYGSISFINTQLTGVVSVTYQTLGGIWTVDDAKIAEILADKLHNPRITTWDEVADLPVAFPVIDHEWNLVDMVGMSELVAAVDGIEEQLRLMGQEGLQNHINDKNNPHNTNKTHVGLGLVRNLPTAGIPEAVAGVSDDYYMTPLTTRNAILAFGGDVASHVANTNNPHNVTAGQTGAYTKSEVNALIINKLDNDETAYDSTRFNGLTYSQAVLDILSGTSANSIQFAGRSYAEVTTDILAGTAANADKAYGKTEAELKTAVLTGKAADSALLNGQTPAQFMAAVQAGTSANSTRFGGMTVSEFQATVQSGTSSNSLKLDGYTLLEVITQARDGTADDAERFAGMLPADYRSYVLTGKAADSDKFDGMTMADFLASLSGVTVGNSDRFGGLTPTQFRDTIAAGDSANAIRFDGKTAAEFKDYVLLGTAYSADRLNGKTETQLTAAILGGTAANATKAYNKTEAELTVAILGGTAANATKAYGKTEAELTAAVLTGTSANSDKLENKTLAEITAEFAASTVANSNKLANLSLQEVLNQAWAGTVSNADRAYGLELQDLTNQILGGTSQNSVRFNGKTELDWLNQLTQKITDETRDNTYAVGYTGLTGQAAGDWWREIIRLSTPAGEPTSDLPDGQWLISGGESGVKGKSPLYLVTIGVRSMSTGTPSISIVDLVGGQNGFEIGYTIETIDTKPMLRIWAKSKEDRSAYTVTELAKNVGEIILSQAPVNVEPGAITYATVDKSGLATKAEVEALRTDTENAIQVIADALQALSDQINA